MNADEERLRPLTERIIGCAHSVSNELGVGFLEKVYENALFVELTRAGLRVEQQKLVVVRYKGVVVGEYLADLVVEGEILVELRHACGIDEVHVAQRLSYLKATGLKVCLVINFGKSRIELKRIVRNL